MRNPAFLYGHRNPNCKELWCRSGSGKIDLGMNLLAIIPVGPSGFNLKPSVGPKRSIGAARHRGPDSLY